MGRMKDKFYDVQECEYVRNGNQIEVQQVFTTTSDNTGPIEPKKFQIQLPKVFTTAEENRISKVPCTLCKTDLFIDPFRAYYPNEEKPYISYRGPKFTRHICNDCHSIALDKLYGINRESEEVLFKESK